jgi:signal transduction histidine kinase
MLKIFFFSIHILFFSSLLYAVTVPPINQTSINKLDDNNTKKRINNDNSKEIVLSLSSRDMGFVHILVMLVIIVNIFVFFFSRINIKIEKKAKEKALKNEKALKHEKREFKNKEIERRFGVISHFLKNPLQGIVSTSYKIIDRLEEKKIIDKIIDNELSTIIEESTALSKRIDDYLHSVRSEFHLNDVIKSSIFFMEKRCKKNNISINYEEKLGYDYYGDKGDLDMVLTLLLENAITALSTFDSQKRIITIELMKEDTTYTIFVKDNGIGIAEDMQPTKIFEKGVSSKEKESGGTGLYLAKSIISDDFKGIIEAYNDNGAVFKITLPNKKIEI